MRIGLLGCGNVGAALVDLVNAQADAVEARTGIRLEVTRIAVRNVSAPRSVDLDTSLLTRDAEAVVTDPDIDIVVEAMGGIEPARSLILDALKSGKPVVTANKELLANVGAELYGAAEAAGRDLLFEASVAGGIPIMRALRESLHGEPVRRVLGIINGTTNFILTKMSDAVAEGREGDYSSTLAEAQRLGYAERDPTADVEGFDAGAKAAIIATVAFGAKVVAGDVYHEGIADVTSNELAVARRLGYVVKLLAIVERDPGNGEISVRVHPALVPAQHPLAAVRDSFNAVFVEGDFVGSLMFYGRGAGGAPTASAVFGDVVDAAVNLRRGTYGSLGELSPATIRPLDETSAEYLLGLDVVDRPGVLHRVTGVFAENNVSIRVAEQEGNGPDAATGVHHPRSAGSRCAGDRPCPARSRCRHLRRRVAPRHRKLSSTVKYVSTRGSAPTLGFADVLLAGLATDGGLYVPESWPKLAPSSGSRSYVERAVEVMAPFVEPDLDSSTLERLCTEAYSTFRHDAVVPLVQIGHQHYVLELFHGPTLAFKDVALQLVGKLFDHVLTERGQRVTIVGATSGDTGSAAIDGVAGCRNVDIVILYPQGRTSEVQRRQMTTVDAPNVHAVAVDGTFDDCQDLVKAMFNDSAVPRRARPVGGELDQLGAGDGPGRLLRDRGGDVRRAGDVLRADGQLRQRARRLDRARDGCTDPRLRDRVEQQRHPDPLHRSRRHVDPPTWWPPSARRWTSRCRRTSSGCCSR